MQFVILNGLECFLYREEIMVDLQESIQVLKDFVVAQGVHLMTLHPDCTVEPKQGKLIDLRTLQDNQSVAKGGENYYFLITRKI